MAGENLPLGHARDQLPSCGGAPNQATLAPAPLVSFHLIAREYLTELALIPVHQIVTKLPATNCPPFQYSLCPTATIGNLVSHNRPNLNMPPGKFLFFARSTFRIQFPSFSFDAARRIACGEITQLPANI